MLEKLLKANIDLNVEVVRSILVKDYTDAIFLKHLRDSSVYSNANVKDNDITTCSELFRPYNIVEAVNALTNNYFAINMLESVDMLHEFKWADSDIDKLQVVVIAFDKATS